MQYSGRTFVKKRAFHDPLVSVTDSAKHAFDHRWGVLFPFFHTRQGTEMMPSDHGMPREPFTKEVRGNKHEHTTNKWSARRETSYSNKMGKAPY